MLSKNFVDQDLKVGDPYDLQLPGQGERARRRQRVQPGLCAHGRHRLCHLGQRLHLFQGEGWQPLNLGNGSRQVDRVYRVSFVVHIAPPL